MAETRDTFDPPSFFAGMIAMLVLAVVVGEIFGLNPQDTICDLRIELAESPTQVVEMLTEHPHCAVRLPETPEEGE